MAITIENLPFSNSEISATNYALKKAKEVSALKAVSQNLMHANLSVTDGVYGILSDKDVRGERDCAWQKNSNE